MSTIVDELSVELRLGVEGFEKGLGNAYNLLDNASKRVQSSTNSMNSAFEQSATKIQASQRAIENQIAKLNQQQRKYDETGNAIMRMTKELDALKDKVQAGGQSFDEFTKAKARIEELEKAIASLDKESIKLADSMGQTQDKLGNMEVGAERTSRTVMSMGTHALSTAASFAGGGSSLSTAISTAGQALYGLQVPGGQFIAIASIITGAIKLIVDGVKSHNEAIQKQIEAVRNGGENLRKLQDDYTKVAEAQKVFSDKTSKADALTEANRRLAETFPDLVQGYGSEGNAIMVSNKLIEERIQKKKEELAAEEKLQGLRARVVMDDMAKAAIKDQEEYVKLLEEQAEWQEKLRRVKAGETVGGITEANPNKHRLGLKETEDELAKFNAKVAEAMAQASLSTEEFNTNLVQQFKGALSEMGELNDAQLQATGSFIQEFVNQNAEAIQNGTMLISDATAQVTENLQTIIQDNANVAKQSLSDVQREVQNLTTAEAIYARAVQESQKLNQAKKLKEYVDVLKDGKKGTDEYNKALKETAKAFNTNEKEVESNIDAYAALAKNGLQSAAKSADALKAALIAQIEQLVATGQMADDAAAAVKRLIGELAALGATSDTSERKGGGGGGSRKAAWEEELELIERVKGVEAEYAQEYVKHIEEQLQNSRLSKAERTRLEKELAYAKMAVDGELEQAHIAHLERILQSEKISADQRLEVERKLFDARLALMQQMNAQIKEGIDAITTALGNKYKAQMDAESKAMQDASKASIAAINNQIKAVRSAADARIKAINDQIKALDDLAKAEDRADQDAADEDKIKRLREQLRHEKDVYNQQKLKEQIAAVEEKQRKRKEKEALEDQKNALRAEIDNIRAQADAQIQALQDQITREQEALALRQEQHTAYWEARLSEDQLYQEAIVMLEEDKNAEIMALLEEFNPEYIRKNREAHEEVSKNVEKNMTRIINELSRAAKFAADNPIVITTIYETINRGGAAGGAAMGALSGSSMYGGGSTTIKKLEHGLGYRAAMFMENAMNALAFAIENPVDYLAPARAMVTDAIAPMRTQGIPPMRGQQRERGGHNTPLTINFNKEVQTPYQHAKAVKRTLEDLAR